MTQDVTREQAAPAATPAASDVGFEMDQRRGARPGDLRIRRSRGHRRGVLQALRGVPGAIRRASPFR